MLTHSVILPAAPCFSQCGPEPPQTSPFTLRTYKGWPFNRAHAVHSTAAELHHARRF